MVHAGQGQLTEEDLDRSPGSLYALKNDLAVRDRDPFSRVGRLLRTVSKKSFSKIFFTYDDWIPKSGSGWPGFVAVSAHWSIEEPSGDPTTRSRLVAIEYVQPDDDPEDIFFEAINKLSLSSQKVGLSSLIIGC